MNHEINPLLAGMQARTTTTNGAQAFRTTLNSCLDLFAKAPMVEICELHDLLTKAWDECPETTTKLAFWLRDPRQGAGRREAGRRALEFVAQRTVGTLSNPTHIANYGRWDDLLSLPIDDKCVKAWVRAARNNKLAAKWLPRESSKKKGVYARTFAKTLGWSSKEYRQFCSAHTEVVETQMCQKQWGNIVYQRVPSQAFRKLNGAFARNDEYRFNCFLKAAESGQTTINAGAIYPHEVIQKTLGNFGRWGNGEVYGAEEAQWKNLPNFFDGPCSTIVVADTSGSMFGGDGKVRPIDVSLALALYCAERMEGPFKDNFITFSRNANLHYVNPNKSIAERIEMISEIVSNTDLLAVYKLLLTTARSLRIKQEDMPKNILIISDMQFDSMVDSSVPHQRAKEMFEQAGYEAPNLIYWNVASAKALPITHNEAGAALVSGYSPAVLKAVFGGDLNPMSVMRRAIDEYPSTLQ